MQGLNSYTAAGLIIRGGSVYDPTNGQTERRDIGIRNAQLVDPEALDGAEILDGSGCVVTHGLIDIHAHFREPGREDKETLETGARAALAGGFTRVCIMPNTDPPIDSPEAIRFLRERAENLPVEIHPIGAITRGLKGGEMAELLEMHAAGAVAFSDDGMPVQDGMVLRRALLYAKDLGVPIINHAEDASLRTDGVMNQGALSTRLGLPGNPTEAEAAMIYRDLLLARETGGRLHIPHVSAAESVELIRRFKADGVQLSAEATPHHLGLTEDLLRSFDTNAKVAPPLRAEPDRRAIVAGLMDGTIDCVATDHAPHTSEDKERDMLHAPCGMIGLETALAMGLTVLSKAGLTLEQIIDLYTVAPAGVMGFDLNPIQAGSAVELVIIDPTAKWEFNQSDIRSRSRNTPMLGMTFTGRVVGGAVKRGWFGGK